MPLSVILLLLQHLPNGKLLVTFSGLYSWPCVSQYYASISLPLLIFLRALAKSDILMCGWQLLCGRWMCKVSTDGSARNENQAKEQVRNQAGKPQPGQQFPEEQIRAVGLIVSAIEAEEVEKSKQENCSLWQLQNHAVYWSLLQSRKFMDTSF